MTLSEQDVGVREILRWFGLGPTQEVQKKSWACSWFSPRGKNEMVVGVKLERKEIGKRPGMGVGIFKRLVMRKR